MKNKLQTIGIITVILIALRCLVESNPQCVLIVSAINIAALLVVVYLICEQIRTGVSDNIKEHNIPKQIEKREIRSFTIKLSLLVYIPFALATVAYLVFWSSGLGNDIIAIVALGLSLCDNHIASLVTSLYRKKD